MGILKKEQHKRLIKSMYPAATRGTESNLKPENVSRVTSFAIRNPKKLPEMAAYVINIASHHNTVYFTYLAKFYVRNIS